MGVSPGRVSQILGGGENLTLRTLAAMSTALDARFAVQLHALKPEDEFSSRNTAETALTGHHLPFSEGQHQEGGTEISPNLLGPIHLTHISPWLSVCALPVQACSSNTQRAQRIRFD